MTVNPTDCFVDLAGFLDSRRDQITKEWLSAIHADSAIRSSESLSVRQLQNHFPELLDRLRDAIRAASLAPSEVEEGAREHGFQRWEHGYRLDELLRELEHVRETVVEHVFEFARQRDGFDLTQMRTALGIVTQFFGEIGCRSAEELSEKQKSGLVQKVHQIEESQGELIEGNERLRMVDESRLRLLRTVSHELRNLLNAVKLSGEALAEDDDETTRRRLAVMLFRNVDHMDELLEDLLDFSSLLAGQKVVKLGRFDPGVLLEEVLYAYEPMAEAKTLKLEGVCEAGLDMLVGDELKIKQIASNLVSNALKYTARGSVTLQFAKAADHHWQIVVQDSGPGIAPDDLGRIFNEFHRLKETETQQGTGLGLAITKRLVDLLGGQIKVESSPEHGSRFEVVLPVPQSVN